MPKATLASRPVKNKSTGLDLSVNSYRETKGMVTSTVYYQVVMVSNLGCFKTPSHKETDVVQCSIEKKLNEFEHLRTQVAELYPGTMLPPINKVAIIVSDAVLRERRNSLNALLKFFASTPSIAVCPPVLEFLGVDSLRAKRFSRGESTEGPQASSTDLTGEDGDEAEGNTPELNFLEEDDDETGQADADDDDLFKDNDENEDTDMFSSKGQVHMFEEQDLKRDLTEEDEKDFGFIPDAIITKREKVTTVTGGEEEDNSQLFQIKDDLDELMKIDVGKKKTPTDGPKEKEKPAFPQESETSKPTKTSPLKPSIPAKPKPAAKPKLPEKPQNPGSAASADGSEKPTPAPRPKPAPRTKVGGVSNVDGSSDAPLSKPQGSTSASDSAADSTTNLGQDDILKYLQDNLAENEEEVDLFS